MGSKKNDKSIPKPSLPEYQKIRFSFEFYDGTKFCISQWEQSNIKIALKRLQEVCRVSFNDMRAGANVYHFHEVDWNRTTEKEGFPNRVINSIQPFQFALLGINNQKARVYGAYASSVFYIVWFDFDHVITPSELRHT